MPKHSFHDPWQRGKVSTSIYLQCPTVSFFIAVIIQKYRKKKSDSFNLIIAWCLDAGKRKFTHKASKIKIISMKNEKRKYL